MRHAPQVRDITTREDWFQKYQYEIPVLAVVGQEGSEHEVPHCSRPSAGELTLQP